MFQVKFSVTQTILYHILSLSIYHFDTFTLNDPTVFIKKKLN